MSWRDAACVLIDRFRHAYPEEPKRLAEWRALAEAVQIPLVEDPELALARRRAAAEQRQASGFGGARRPTPKS